jgi:hypothetical protein
MRVPALAILTIGMVFTAAPARAQTYNPDYPVCLQVYDVDGGYISCGYTSLAQCAQSASGVPPSVHHQSIFCGRACASGSTLSAASPCLLNVSAYDVVAVRRPHDADAHRPSHLSRLRNSSIRRSRRGVADASLRGEVPVAPRA